MRKTLRNALGAVLGTVLVTATMAGTATPAYAADCGTPAPLDVRGEVGTIDRLQALWWTHTVDADSRVVSLATPGGSATLEVRDVDCATVLCTDGSSAAETAKCTLEAGEEVVVGVVGDPPSGPEVLNQVTAFVVNVLEVVPGECNDGLDNDRDGRTDYPADVECRSADDRTEAPVHVAAYGDITIETNASNTPTMSLTGVFADPARFRCDLDETPLIAVTCEQVYNSEFLYECTHMVLTAKAFSTAKPVGPGSAKGSIVCDSGNVLTTDDVDSSQTLTRTVDEADSFHPYVRLGTAHLVVCRAQGINNTANATGAYTVRCAEPGVAWPVETVPNPAG